MKTNRNNPTPSLPNHTNNPSNHPVIKEDHSSGPLTPWLNQIPNAIQVVLCALLVARPMISTADPGHLMLTTGAGGLTLNLCGFILLFLFFLYQKYSKQPIVWGGWKIGLLLTLVLLSFLSAGFRASYSYPAYLIAWDWANLVALVFLLLQWRSKSGGAIVIAIALLANAFSQVLWIGYQLIAPHFYWPVPEINSYSVDVPLVGDERFSENINRPGCYTQADWRQSETIEKPLIDKTLSFQQLGKYHGSFDCMETLIGYLLLITPFSVYTAVRIWKYKQKQQRFGLLLWSCWLIVLALGLIYFLQQPWAERLQMQKIGSKLLWQHLELGIGGGNFSRFADGHIPGTANGWIDLGCDLGLGGICFLLLFCAVPIFSYLKLKKNRNTANRLHNQPLIESANLSDFSNLHQASQLVLDNTERKIVYLGGMFGAILGFVLGSGDIPAEAPAKAFIEFGIQVAIRAVLWFAIIALVQKLSWVDVSLRRVLFLGVLLLLLYGFVSSSFTQMVLLQPLLFLVISSLPPQKGEADPTKKLFFLEWLCSPLALLLLSIYLLGYYIPAASTVVAVREARQNSRYLPDTQTAIRLSSGRAQAEAALHALKFLRANILNPLERACQSNPNQSSLWLEFVRWKIYEWEFQMILKEEARAGNISKQLKEKLKIVDQLDPRNPTRERLQIDLLYRMIEKSRANFEKRIQLLRDSIDHYCQIYPSKKIELLQRTLGILIENEVRMNRKSVVKYSETERKWNRDQLIELAKEIFTLATDPETSFGQLSESERRYWIQKLQETLENIPDDLNRLWLDH